MFLDYVIESLVQRKSQSHELDYSVEYDYTTYSQPSIQILVVPAQRIETHKGNTKIIRSWVDLRVPGNSKFAFDSIIIQIFPTQSEDGKFKGYCVDFMFERSKDEVKTPWVVSAEDSATRSFMVDTQFPEGDNLIEKELKEFWANDIQFMF